MDTFPPSLVLEPGERRGSLATVRWEAKDENLDLKSLVLEYQVGGIERSGARCRSARPKLNGSRDGMRELPRPSRCGLRSLIGPAT